MVTDEHIAESLRTSNEEYRELEESHHRLDAELQQLLKHHVLTPQEEEPFTRTYQLVLMWRDGLEQIPPYDLFYQVFLSEFVFLALLLGESAHDA